MRLTLPRVSTTLLRNELHILLDLKRYGSLTMVGQAGIGPAPKQL